MTKARVRRSLRSILSCVIPSLYLPLLFTGCGGNVTVTSVPPTVGIAANPASIVAGSSSTLTVSATNATQVTVTGSDSITYTLQESGGTQAVSPKATTTYTAAATGAGGNASATATVTVTSIPAPVVTILANPTSIASGNSSTLTVVATNATQVTVSGTDGSKYTLQASGGTQSVSPAKTETYTAAATGAGGNASATATVTVTSIPAPVVTILANPTSIVSGNSSTLTVVATNATQVTLTGDGSTYTLAVGGGTQAVSPAATTTYTAAATGAGGNASATATVTVVPASSLQSINHVIFMMQENHSFDNYFGMLNPYREHPNGPGMPCPPNASGVPQCWNIGDDGVTYSVDGIDDKLTTISNVDDEGTSYSLFKFTSTCIDDESSDWLASYGDVNRYDFLTTRPILMDGFVHNAEGYANSCKGSGGGSCAGNFTDLTGHSAMGYYDEGFFNYYYYMASQFAVSDRWFSPVATKSIGNRIATFTGGTTQGLVKDPGGDDHLPQLDIPNIFQELDQAGVSWKIYYTVTEGFCLSPDYCPKTSNAQYPATFFSNLTYSYQYLHQKTPLVDCSLPTQPSSVVGDSTNSFCIDPNHIAPLPKDVAPLYNFFTDLANGTLPSFAFIEAGYGNNDEHPGSGQSVLLGQAQVASVVNSFMTSTSWKDSVFFFSYDEGGGPYDHVPPVPGYSNKFTDAMVGDTPVANIPDIGGVGAKDGFPGTGGIAVNPDATPEDPTLYFPCVPTTPGTATLHCDLASTDPGAKLGDPPAVPGDAAAVNGFAAQLGFRLPNIVISPFTRRHYVSHTPMDHTAVIKFVENRFIGPSAHLTPRDAAQPDLLEFFDFTNVPWSTPPFPPIPVTAQSLGHDPCTPGNLGP